MTKSRKGLVTIRSGQFHWYERNKKKLKKEKNNELVHGPKTENLVTSCYIERQKRQFPCLIGN